MRAVRIVCWLRVLGVCVCVCVVVVNGVWVACGVWVLPVVCVLLGRRGLCVCAQATGSWVVVFLVLRGAFWFGTVVLRHVWCNIVVVGGGVVAWSMACLSPHESL